MHDPPFGRDRASYKEQRRKDLGNTSRKMADDDADDGMFFGTSPKERKGLRETVDKRKLDLDQLDLNAVDRDKFTEVPQVGKTLRLIDMAMGTDEQEASKPAPAKPPPARPVAKRPPQPTARRAPARPTAARPKPPAGQPARPTRPATKPPTRAAQPPARPAAKPPAKKPGTGKKGMKISDMGLTVKPRKVGNPPPKKRPR